MARARCFTFTMNNYPDTSMVDTIDCKYIIYGKEGKEPDKTDHLQGFIQVKQQATLKAMIKRLPGCHVEIARDLHHAIEYCKKEEDFTERGDRPKTGDQKGADEQERWLGYRMAAEEGRLEEIPEKIKACHYKYFQHCGDQASKKRKLEDTETQHEWYWGESGTGKSRKAREENPDAYLKMCNKWWCGYDDEEVVIIEDFDKKHDVLAHHLKIWADRYPHLAEYKGGAKKIRPKKLIVTSNYHPREIWTDPSDLEPIERRFNCIEFKAFKRVKL